MTQNDHKELVKETVTLPISILFSKFPFTESISKSQSLNYIII